MKSQRDTGIVVGSFEGPDNSAMSRRERGGRFVVLGGLCVSRRGRRRPEEIRSERWSQRVDEEERKLLNGRRL